MLWKRKLNLKEKQRKNYMNGIMMPNNVALMLMDLDKLEKVIQLINLRMKNMKM